MADRTIQQCRSTYLDHACFRPAGHDGRHWCGAIDTDDVVCGITFEALPLVVPESSARQIAAVPDKVR